MTDRTDAPGNPGDDEPDETSGADAGGDARQGPPAHPGRVPSLDAFAAAQRQVASFDFSALRAAQRAIEQAGGLQKIVDAQNAIAKNFARSVDFSRLAGTHRALIEGGAAAQAAAAQKRWAESLARSIDFSALNSALVSSIALDSLVSSSPAFNESLRKQTEFIAEIAKSVTFKLPKIDMSRLRDALDRWLPVNLREVVGLDVVATIALDEGLPLAWVPRSEIVERLVDASDSEERVNLLAKHRGDILDDCEESLESVDHEWAVQCGFAVAAMRAGLDGPAQSHASNIIDSIVLGLHGKNGREHAKKRAQEDFDDLPLQLAAENLTLRPLFRAFTTWFPNTGTDPPDYFARHATSHAVGHVGVFAPLSALVAVMLATSLTVQYAPEIVRTDENHPDALP